MFFVLQSAILQICFLFLKKKTHTHTNKEELHLMSIMVTSVLCVGFFAFWLVWFVTEYDIYATKWTFQIFASMATVCANYVTYHVLKILYYDPQNYELNSSGIRMIKKRLSSKLLAIAKRTQSIARYVQTYVFMFIFFIFFSFFFFLFSQIRNIATKILVHICKNAYNSAVFV